MKENLRHSFNALKITMSMGYHSMALSCTNCESSLKANCHVFFTVEQFAEMSEPR